MKTEDFMNKLVNNGFSVKWDRDKSAIFQIFYGGEPCGTVDRFRTRSFDIFNTTSIPGSEKARILMNTMLEFASTPIDERIESKKYYARHKWIGLPHANYLNVCNDGRYVLAARSRSGLFKTQFTKKEIEAIKKKHDADMEEFDIEEVEE